MLCTMPIPPPAIPRVRLCTVTFNLIDLATAAARPPLARGGASAHLDGAVLFHGSMLLDGRGGSGGFPRKQIRMRAVARGVGVVGERCVGIEEVCRRDAAGDVCVPATPQLAPGKPPGEGNRHDSEEAAGDDASNGEFRER
jgi:hypothetical protein